MYMDKTCKDIKEGYTWEARSQYKGTPLPGPLFVCATLYHKSNRVVDIDNFNKLAFDALTGIVWEDDSQITDYYTKKRIDKTNPRIEFIITPYE